MLVIAVAVVAYLILSGGSSYRVHMVVQDAGQLVKGNLVQVGGVKVGAVSKIELDSNNLADVTLKITDSSYDPLHHGTQATIRSTSLSAVAGRVVALEPGPNSEPKIGDGGTIGYESSQGIVDLDAVLNTLDMQTRTTLQSVVHDSAALYAKDTEAANKGLAALNPALSQLKGLTDELLTDRRTFEQFIVQGAGTVSAVADKDSDLESGLIGAAKTANAVAAQTNAIDRTLKQAPDTMRRANTTLVNARAALDDLRPTLREARPVAPRLRKVLQKAAPTTRKAKPVISQTTQLLPNVKSVLDGLPALDSAARPAFASTTEALSKADPDVRLLRNYLPELVGGLLNGFGGSTGGYYDANGHYVRIAANAGSLSLTGLASLLGVATANNGGALKTGLLQRCPGGAAEPGADKSNPYKNDDTSFCNTDQTP